MSTSVDFTDWVPPVDHLLANGIPSIAALDTYIADLDLDLEENAKELDTCLHDMLKLTNTIVGKEYITPRDALLSMLSTHALEKESCYDPDSDAVTEILSHAWHQLDQVPGSEEAVFQDLLTLASQQGLTLPLKSAVVDPIASTMSLNAVSDNSEIQIAQQWDQISLRLRRYFLERLSHLPVAPYEPLLNVCEKRRLMYVQSLISLQPVDEVWERYQTMRHQQLELCLSLLMPETETDVNIVKISENCAEIAQIIIQMMNEDFSVLSSGVMKKAPKIFHAFHKTYLEKYSDEMSALVDEVMDEIHDTLKRVKSSNAISGHNSLRRSKVKGGGAAMHASHSVDSVASIENQPMGSQPTLIPPQFIRIMLNVVTTLQQIEDHLDGLQKAAIWDVGGISIKKSHRKGSLKGVLKPSSSPDINKRPASASLSIDSDFSDMTASCISTSSVQFDTQPTPKVQVVEKMKPEEKVRWSWKMIFKRVAPDLATSIEHEIHTCLKASLDVEVQQWTSSHTLETVPVLDSLVGGRLDYPRVISKGTGTSVFMKAVEVYLGVARAVVEGYLQAISNDFLNWHTYLTFATFQGTSVFMKEVETYLGVAKAGAEGYLHPVRTAFIDITNTCLKNFHSHLLKSPIQNLYTLLSSAAYIRNQLLHFDIVLAPDDSKKPFSLQYKQFVELVESLTSTVVQRHGNYIATSVLHDTDSHNWTENKEFFEAERCSFPVQMWHYYLTGMQYDMWSLLPPKLAQSTFAVILHDSLQILTHRYTHASPSFRRVGQFRCDIMTILLCVSEQLFWVSGSLSRVLDAGHTQAPHYAIHNLCTTLLSAMVVIAAPLPVMYKVNKKGFRYRQRRKSLTQGDRGNNTNWLAWIRPTILDKTSKSLNDLRTTVALYLHTKLLLRQPELNFPLTLQTCVQGQTGNSSCRCSVFLLSPLASLTGSPRSYSLSSTAEAKKITPISSVIEELPCGCRSHATATPRYKRAEVVRDTVDHILKLVLGQMVEDMFVLPTSVITLLKALEQQCASRGLKTPHHCVGTKFVALSLREYLLNTTLLSDDLGLTLTPALKEEFKLLADCVYHVLVSGKVKSSSTPRLAGRFCKDNKEWINDKVQILINYLGSELFDGGSNPVLQGSTGEFQEQFYQGLAMDLLSTKHGDEDMQRLYWLLHHNQDWLHRQLDIRHGLLLARPFSDTEGFQLDMTPAAPADYNPIVEHQKIGSYKFDHAMIEDLTVDWEKLLQADLGLSEVGFRSLLYNRHEMQDGAYLEDSEKKPVTALRAMFENDPRELR
ncbi:K0825-like protein [Mya arenaria]|uniref:K0825-like protein n=1 Tax=Mya arenaria TaxID=6604 RepID=A0ABY7DQU8_MYAAR|nr:K0825-like protein [Mya arenaria]